MRNKGFTLIELMVVVAVIGILATMLVPSVSKMIDKTRVARTVGELTTIVNAMDVYLADVGSYPPSVQDWGRPWGADVGLVGRGAVHPNHLSAWNGPYLKNWPIKTAWGGIVGCGATGAYYIHIPIGWIDGDGIGGNDYWVHMNADCVRYPSAMGIEIDELMDDGNGGAGNFRVYPWCGGGACIYFYVGEGSRSW